GAGTGVGSVATFDIADPEGARSGVQSIVDRTGRLDILVNNAGTTADALVLRLKEEEWERALRVNLTGAFHCTKVALRVMIRGRYGRIVNLSSVVAGMGKAGQGACAACQGGV